jgi:hypothetical protein
LPYACCSAQWPGFYFVMPTGLQHFVSRLTVSQGPCNCPRHVSVRHVACQHCSWPRWELGEFKFCLSSFSPLPIPIPSLANSRDFAPKSRHSIGSWSFDWLRAGVRLVGLLSRPFPAPHRIASHLYLPSPTSRVPSLPGKNLLSRILSSLLPVQLSASPSHLSSPYRHI